MSNNIGINVQAQFDNTALIQKINQAISKLSEAGKTKFEPVSAQSIQNMDKLVQRAQALLKLSADFKSRVKATGQGGKGFFDLDYGSLYSDPNQRALQMRKHLEYVLGQQLTSAQQATPPPPRRPPGAPPPVPPGARPPPANRPGDGSVSGTAAEVVQGGLRATGPVGGVAANSIGRFMSGGFGAGMAGLVGGLGALALGKAVGAVMDRVGAAEDEAVAMDRLKRTLGDVNVSFNALKAAVHGSANMLGVTFSEAERLTSSFVRSSNLSGSAFTSIPGELDVGVGMSRAFGLDPAQGVGLMGQMRGLGVTQSTQDSRRMALLIGETIGKSDAFAKAGEVMEAIAGFAEAQTRRATQPANVADYAGLFAGIVGAKIPGLDPSGTANLLSRLNSAVQGGGAFGEASQFFTGMVGAKMGMDPIQTRVLREGGFFATPGQMFGKGSAADAFGLKGPTGDKPLGFAMLDQLRQQYGKDPGMLAMATANHFGIGINEAMRLLSISPKQIGDLQSRFGGQIDKLSPSGIANMAIAASGTAEQRSALASEFLARGDLKSEDRAKIEAAQGDDSKLQQVLPAIVGQYEQTRSMGTDVRDSRAALENIQSALAEKLVPYMNEARLGIMKLAGVGKDGVTTDSIMRGVMDADHNDRMRRIRERFEPKRLEIMGRKREAVSIGSYDADKAAQADRELEALEKERNALLDKENGLHQERIKRMEKQQAEEDQRLLSASEDPAVTGSLGGSPLGGVPGQGRGAGAYRSGGGGPPLRAASDSDVDEAIQFFMGKGWSREAATGIVSNLVAESQLNPGAVGDGGKALGVAQWHADRRAAIEEHFGKSFSQMSRKEQYEAVHWEMTESRDAGARQAGRLLRGNLGPGESAGVFTRNFERPRDTWGESARRGAFAEEQFRKGAGTRTGLGVQGPGKVERGPDLPPLERQSMVPIDGRTGTSSAALSGQMSPVPVAGEMSIRLELNDAARSLLRPPAAPISTRVASNWQPR